MKLEATGPGVVVGGEAISTLLGGEVGRKLSMHVVAACPLYLAPADVPKDVVDRETAIFRYCICMCLVRYITDTFAVCRA